MTRLIIALSALVISSSLPVFANGPMPADNSNSTSNSNMNPGRERWTRNRIKHLKHEMEEHRKADQTARNIDRILGGADENVGRVMFPQGASSAARRRYMINRYEFLALKAERGNASAKDIAEMRALRAALLP
jgi:hypothetical protein